MVTTVVQLLILDNRNRGIYVQFVVLQINIYSFGLKFISVVSANVMSLSLIDQYRNYCLRLSLLP